MGWAGDIARGCRTAPLGRRGLLRGLAGAALAPRLGWSAVLPDKADRILVFKADRLLHLVKDERVFATYPIALGGEPVGPKRRQGDGRTPEGRYVIDGKNPASTYHLALHVSYPNQADLARARKAGVNPGGDICVHGLPKGYEALDPIAFLIDWTRGCIAVSDRAIEEIWDRVDTGTPIEIRA